MIDFLREQFPGWAIDPLHTQFTDNEFGPAGEIRHVPYGDGTLRSGPLAEAAAEAGLRMIVISEAKDEREPRRDPRRSAERRKPRPDRSRSGDARPVGSGRSHFPDQLHVEPDGDAFVTIDQHRRVRLTNVDKGFFPDDGYTKGDLIQYYAAVAPLLLPHLAGRALSMARYPNGADGDFFYEKQCPSHAPEWMVTAPLHSSTSRRADRVLHRPRRRIAGVDREPRLHRDAPLAEPGRIVRRIQTSPCSISIRRKGQPGSKSSTSPGSSTSCSSDSASPPIRRRPGPPGSTSTCRSKPSYEYREVRRFVETLGRMIAVGRSRHRHDGVGHPQTGTADVHRPQPERRRQDHGFGVLGSASTRGAGVDPRSRGTSWTDVHPDDFTIATIWERLRQYGDLFAPVLAGGQTLEGASRALGL